jgi:hypothetical protein
MISETVSNLHHCESELLTHQQRVLAFQVFWPGLSTFPWFLQAV